VWRSAEDPASTPALDYAWSTSGTYSILLAILNIDTRIVVGHSSFETTSTPVSLYADLFFKLDIPVFRIFYSDSG
jgi:hypothetical protein